MGPTVLDFAEAVRCVGCGRVVCRCGLIKYSFRNLKRRSQNRVKSRKSWVTYVDNAPVIEVDQLIVNDTERSLSHNQVQALMKGFNFIPTRTLLVGYDTGLKRLRWSINLNCNAQLQACKGYNARRSLLGRIVKSDFEPPGYVAEDSPIWKKFVERLGLVNRCKINNFNNSERKAWRELLEHPTTFLTKADKGGKPYLGIKSDYQRESFRQLKNRSVYRPLSEQQAKSLIDASLVQRNEILEDLVNAGNITRKEADRTAKVEWRIPPSISCRKFIRQRTLSRERTQDVQSSERRETR